LTPPGARDVFVEANGLRLHLLDWGGEGQPILCIHATGFLAALWHPVAVALATRARVLGLDLRGHGDSEGGDSYWWSVFPDDVGGALSALDLGPAVLVGHSVGGAAAALCAARHPELVRGLVLVDPVIFPESHYDRPQTAEGSDLLRSAGRRKRAWPSREAMRQSLGGKLPFVRWLPEVFDLYVENAVRSTSDGRVELKCIPETEGAIYVETLRFNLWPEIVRARVPTLVLRGLAEHGLPSTTTRNLAQLLPSAEDWPVESAGHLIPMEAPEEVTAAVQVLLDRLASTSGC
jgi:pimeloyl-ACP methyl ester carboxylesterase